MKDIDDIEILDSIQPKKVEKNNGIKSKGEEKSQMTRQSKKRKVKVRSFQILFCAVSALFILGCCVFYGSRLIKYYKIYNPKGSNGEKVTLLANYIVDGSVIVHEDGSDGLYSVGGFTYKGIVSNNYVKYANMLWRILKINVDGTIQLISDDYVNVISWNKQVDDFTKSDISSYLNNVFIKALNTNLLVKSHVCNDNIDDLSKITCDKPNNDNYVSLLDINTYLNTVINKNTFLSTNDEIFWLNNRSSEKVWHTNGNNISQSDSTSFYEVRPVIVLSSTILHTNGDGTKDNPYLVDSNSNIGVGSIIKLGDDKWIVYEINENIKLMKYDVLDKTYRFDKELNVFDPTSEGSIAKYLNTTYLDSLSYKNLLVDNEWYIGSFNGSYLDIKENKVKSKVGIPNLLDIKFNSSANNYFLSTSDGKEHMYVYKEAMGASKPSVYRSVRPCVAISKNTIIKSGKGSLEEPFVVEE